MITSHSFENVKKDLLYNVITPEGMITDSILLSPPAHIWLGPQPGLPHQTDERRRYKFSEKSGRLEHIVSYGDNGVPAARTQYRYTSDLPQSQPVPTEFEHWQDGAFIAYGSIDSNGRALHKQKFLRTMIAANGEEREIPTDSKKFFVTPAGKVVHVLDMRQLVSQLEAECVGRIRGFDSERPFVVRTIYGDLPLAVDRADVLISALGIVYEITESGLKTMGEVIFGNERGKKQEQTATSANEFCIIQLDSQEISSDSNICLTIRDQECREFINRPLQAVAGKHPFIQSHVPELIDLNGGTAGEEQLRVVEQTALELGLVLYALQKEQRLEMYPELTKAQHFFEERLWKQASDLEQLVGMVPNTLIHADSIREWVDSASYNPAGALASLKKNLISR